MLLQIGYFTAFLIPLVVHIYALIYRKRKKTGGINILVFSLPLAISAEAIATYGFSLRYETLIWVAWILTAFAFDLLSFAVDECCYADVVEGSLIKIGLNRDQSKLTDIAGGKIGITFRLLITLIAISFVCAALYFSLVTCPRV